MSGPLDDIVVIDLSRALAGPHAGMMLGDLGARVIKVETPGTGWLYERGVANGVRINWARPSDGGSIIR